MTDTQEELKALRQDMEAGLAALEETVGELNDSTQDLWTEVNARTPTCGCDEDVVELRSRVKALGKRITQLEADKAKMLTQLKAAQKKVTPVPQYVAAVSAPQRKERRGLFGAIKRLF